MDQYLLEKIDYYIHRFKLRRLNLEFHKRCTWKYDPFDGKCYLTFYEDRIPDHTHMVKWMNYRDLTGHSIGMNMLGSGKFALPSNYSVFTKPAHPYDAYTYDIGEY